MYSLWNRLNAVFFYAVTALFVAAAASSVTTLWFTPLPVVHKLRLSSVSSLRAVRETRFSKEAVDRAMVYIDLDADLRGIWNWNVKQLYVYVTASYESPNNGTHEIVIWDDIVLNATASQLRLTAAYNDYPLFDRGTDLRGRPVTLSLAWDVMPITGYLYRASQAATRVRMPPQYCNAAECTLEQLETLLPTTSEFDIASGGGASAATGASKGAAAGRKRDQ